MEGFLQAWLVGFTYFLYTLFTQPLSKIGVVGNPWVVHRGLKLDGAIGQGEICNSLKSEKNLKSFLSNIGKNKIKFKKK